MQRSYVHGSDRLARLALLLSLAPLASCALEVGSDELEGEGEVGLSRAALLSGAALYVANSAVLSPADTLLRNRMQGMGLTVQVKAAAATTSADANGKVVVVISSTVAPADVAAKFRATVVPVVTWESQLYDDMGMTPATAGSFGTQSGLWNVTMLLNSPPHPLSAGWAGTPTVVTASTTLNWGQPASSAVRISTIPGNAGRLTEFAYKRGALMSGLVAPGARVGLFLGDTTANSLDATGWSLFEAAIHWAIWNGPDTDGDGLSNAVETDTGIFVDRSNTGTDPNDTDTDDDGIGDGAETLGTAEGLNLPAMGCNPLRKNILLEHDWFTDALDCASHSHRPTAAALAQVTTAFANAPVGNPNGSTGITLIHDYGQGGAFTGGNFVSDADGVLVGRVGDTEFQNYKASNFAARRAGYFHYVLHAHRFDTNSSSSGVAEILGDDLIVSLQCFLSDTNVANTIMHELGHNLNLLHGGNVNTNRKPNYNSVMNYEYQFPGVDTDCTPPGNGLLDYSRNQRITLDENALLETNGICNGVDWDWNGNGVINTSAIARDVNGDAVRTTLSDHDDWANIVYDWDGAVALRRSGATISDCNNPAPK